MTRRTGRFNSAKEIMYHVSILPLRNAGSGLAMPHYVPLAAEASAKQCNPADGLSPPLISDVMLENVRSLSSIAHVVRTIDNPIIGRIAN